VKKNVPLVIYTENKSTADCAQRWGGKVKNAIKIYQNYIYQFQYKGNVLNEPLKVAHGTMGSRET
jgi:hypothetical protein